MDHGRSRTGPAAASQGYIAHMGKHVVGLRSKVDDVDNGRAAGNSERYTLNRERRGGTVEAGQTVVERAWPKVGVSRGRMLTAAGFAALHVVDESLPDAWVWNCGGGGGGNPGVRLDPEDQPQTHVGLGRDRHWCRGLPPQRPQHDASINGISAQAAFQLDLGLGVLDRGANVTHTVCRPGGVIRLSIRGSA